MSKQKHTFILTIVDDDNDIILKKEYPKLLHISKDLNIPKNKIYRIFHKEFSYNKRRDKKKWSKYSIEKKQILNAI